MMGSLYRVFEAPFDAIPRPLRGMLLMLASSVSVVVMNVTIRHVSDDVHVFEVVFFRNLFAFLMFAPWFFGSEVSPFRTSRFGMLTLRAVLNTLAQFGHFAALALIPLADVTALGFTSPLFATLLAVLLLRESMSGRRWAGLLLGLIGALIILRPGIVEVGLGQGFVLLSTSTWACALIVIKLLSRTESSLTIAMYSGLLQVPLAFAAAVFVWTWPSFQEIGLYAMIGVLGGFAQLCLAQAFRDADATLVLPVDFTKLVWASIAGYLFFAEMPDVWTWVGAAVVCGAVLYMAIREKKERSVGEAV